jgi:glutathione S-transferase
MSEKIKLIASRFSPYCHRVEMTLIEKEIPYEKEEIILSEKPDWFIKDAPLGKVPLLYSNGKPLFESIAICEYLEEAFAANPLHPQDKIVRAWQRGWMEFSNGILAGTFGLIFSQNQAEFDVKKTETISRLTILDQHLKFSPYFGGEKFALVDICMASALKPLVFIDNKFALEIFDFHRNSATYCESVLARKSLHQVLPTDYEEFFLSFLERKKSHLLTVNFKK